MLARGGTVPAAGPVMSDDIRSDADRKSATDAATCWRTVIVEAGRPQ
jgi:hypothetical protein